MTLPVVLVRQAELEFGEAAEWYEKRADGLGVDFVGCVRDALSKIAALPSLWPEAHNEIRRAPVRRFPYGVFYRIRQDDMIEVIGVIHDRRNPSILEARSLN